LLDMGASQRAGTGRPGEPWLISSACQSGSG
jgi:hypothetical protein